VFRESEQLRYVTSLLHQLSTDIQSSFTVVLISEVAVKSSDMFECLVITVSQVYFCVQILMVKFWNSIDLQQKLDC